MEYTLTDLDGEVLETTMGGKPLEFVFGSGALFPGLEAELLGLRVGDQKVVVLRPEQAYGERDKDALSRFRAEDLHGKEITVGMKVRRICTDGRAQSYTVTGKLGGWIYGDANHPFAGKSLRYDVRIADVR